jgi:hypothetical protein
MTAAAIGAHADTEELGCHDGQSYQHTPPIVNQPRLYGLQCFSLGLASPL